MFFEWVWCSMFDSSIAADLGRDPGQCDLMAVLKGLNWMLQDGTLKGIVKDA